MQIRFTVMSAVEKKKKIIILKKKKKKGCKCSCAEPRVGTAEHWKQLLEGVWPGGDPAERGSHQRLRPGPPPAAVTSRS